MICPHCQAQAIDSAKFCPKCGGGLTSTMTAQAAPAATIDESPLANLVGKTIGGRYRVLAKLGQGGMGTVFRAEQVSLRRMVALKVLDPAVFTGREHVQRFHAEAETAAKLSHPHTVTLYDFGETSEHGARLLFIAMELIPGRSLRAVIADDGPLTGARVCDIAEQVASSLADAHAHGIVHRDLKPDNVMLSERAGRRDFARVLDFGIAKMRDAPAGAGGGGVSAFPAVTRVGDILGTPLYMSPEQLLGEKVDGRADVYALGVMLYEMLTQRLPFDAKTLPAMLSMHLHSQPIPMEQRRPEVQVDPTRKQLIARCMAKPREQRPEGMEVLRAELARLRDALGGGGPGVTPTGGQPAAAYQATMAATPPVAHAFTPPPTHVPSGAVAGYPQTGPAYPQTGPAYPQTGPASAAYPQTGAPIGYPPTGPAPAAYPQTGPAPAAYPQTAPAPAAYPPPSAVAQIPAAVITPPASAPAFSTTAAPARSRTPLILALLVILAGLGVGAYFLFFRGGSDDASDTPSPSPTFAPGPSHDPDPSLPPGPSNLAGPRPDLDLPRASLFHSSRYSFYVAVPPGFGFAENTTELVQGSGEIDGQAAILSASIFPTEVQLTTELVEAMSDQIITSAGGVLVEKRRRSIGGVSYLSLIFDLPALNLRAESVIYPRRSFLVGLALSTTRDSFDDSEDVRDELFEHRVGFDDTP